MFKEFKEFAIKGSAIDLAIGVIIGAAFSSIVTSLVTDVFTPLLGVVTGQVDLSTLELKLPGENVLKYGMFISAIINFLIVSFVVFIMVKQINRFRSKPNAAPNSKECPFCKSTISLKAIKCPNCTADLS